MAAAMVALSYYRPGVPRGELLVLVRHPLDTEQQEHVVFSVGFISCNGTFYGLHGGVQFTRNQYGGWNFTIRFNVQGHRALQSMNTFTQLSILRGHQVLRGHDSRTRPVECRIVYSIWNVSMQQVEQVLVSMSGLLQRTRRRAFRPMVGTQAHQTVEGTETLEEWLFVECAEILVGGLRGLPVV